jgi:hypothetical protein
MSDPAKWCKPWAEYGRSWVRLRRRLAAHEVDVRPTLRQGTEPDRISPGGCYARALQFCRGRLDEPGLVVAAGLVDTVPGSRCGHVWCELPGGVVFDGTFQRFYDQQGYYRVTRAAVRVRLPAREFFQLPAAPRKAKGE